MTHGQARADAAPSMRLDKWLWAARFFKTRALAAEAVDKGSVLVNGQAAKRSRELRCADTLQLRGAAGAPAFTCRVLALSAQRGPAPIAQALYEETADSQAARQAFHANRHLLQDPAQAQQAGRPTKRDRRDLVDWQRWSASIDDRD
jgi:ribosome-associated heat shock protein Hsp15